MSDDTYYALKGEGEAQIREKMSRFIGFALPVASADEARARIKEYQNRYHDARHVCWAYMIGPDRSEWQLNDNGEPSGTAGKPILGQLNSTGVTDAVVIVVRYFGGIKLGTPGLIAAYRQTAREAIEAAGIKEMHAMKEFTVEFPYVSADRIMKFVKADDDIEVRSQEFDNVCRLALSVRLDRWEEVRGRIGSIEGAQIAEN
ncbi:MAG: YigZ family protein [Bacteroides sp.]|nr:YigZ family protein [Bacteroides sp.]